LLFGNTEDIVSLLYFCPEVTAEEGRSRAEQLSIFPLINPAIALTFWTPSPKI